MKNTSKVIVRMTSAAMLALLGLGGGARLAVASDSGDTGQAQPSSSSGHSAAKANHGHMTATVSSIDKPGRNLSVIGNGGQEFSMSVPNSVKGFNKVKQGDRVQVNYQDSIAVSLVGPGERAKSPAEMKQAAAKTGGEAAATSCPGNLQSTANVVSVDQDKGTLTFRGAGGQVRTVTAVDPAIAEKLGSLNQGDLIQVTYTEPVATSIAPASGE